MNLLEMVNDAIENGGGTYYIAADLWDGTLSAHKSDKAWGYYVSQSGGKDDLTISQLLKEIPEYAFRATNNSGTAYFLGLWRNPETNLWSVDISRWVMGSGEARISTVASSQTAYWDIENGEAINV